MNGSRSRKLTKQNLQGGAIPVSFDLILMDPRQRCICVFAVFCIYLPHLSNSLQAQVFGGIAATVAKTTVYYQSNSTGIRLVNPALDPGSFPYYFIATADPLYSLSITAATLTNPTNLTFDLEQANSNSYRYTDRKSLKPNLDSFYPNGNYTMSLGYQLSDGSTFSREATLSLGGDFYQTNPPPTFINASNASPYLSDAGTLPVLATEDLVIAWRAFTNAVASDSVRLNIFNTANSNAAPVFDAEIAPTNQAPFVVIPAGTLTNGIYECLLLYDRQSDLTTVTYDTATNSVIILTRSSYTTVTRLLLTATSAVRLKTTTPAGLGQFRFEFRSLTNRNYEVQSSTNCSVWTTLLSTNAVKTNVIIQQPRTNAAKFFRVISH